MKKLKITTGGHGENTKVEIDGEELKRVKTVKFEANADKLTQAEIELYPEEIIVKGEISKEKITIVEPGEKNMYNMDIPSIKPGFTMLTTFIQHAKSKNIGVISVFFEDHLAKHPDFNRHWNNYMQSAIEAIQSEKMEKPKSGKLYARAFKVIENPAKPDSLTFHTSEEGEDPGFIQFHIPEELR